VPGGGGQSYAGHAWTVLDLKKNHQMRRSDQKTRPSSLASMHRRCHQRRRAREAGQWFGESGRKCSWTFGLGLHGPEHSGGKGGKSKLVFFSSK
jgi:hypothetical protein